jgi:predicted AlkP superfamily phosphohydrolase/phosphomutase
MLHDLMNRGLIIGLDGLDYDFLKTHRDTLPVLSSLIHENASGRLRSTIPPATATAWTAGLSGMNPARTGITDFDTGDSSESDGEVVTSREVEVPRVWDIVEANGGESVVIGVPVTFPATCLDGMMISGFLAPDKEGRFYPTDLADKLPEEYEFYVSSPEPGGRQKYLNRLHASADAKFDLVEQALNGDLSGAKNPDLSCFVISELDWIQHEVRHHPTSDEYEEGERLVLEFLQHLDKRVGGLVADFDGPVLLMSDHGFGKYTTHHVFLNEWLIQRGDLVLENDSDTKLKHRIGRNIRRLLSLPGSDILKSLAPKKIVGSVAEMSALPDTDIDWAKSRARYVQVFTNTGYIILNKDNIDQVEQYVDSLVEDLSKLKDPEAGDTIIDTVYTAEEYYEGSAADDLPEVLFVWEDRYSGAELPNSNVVSRLPTAERPPPAHKMDGFYAFVGDQFKPIERDLDIYDVAPTLYRSMGLPIPTNVDGRVHDDLASSLPPVSPSTSEYKRNSPFVTDSGTNQQVEQRLEDLGYK